MHERLNAFRKFIQFKLERDIEHVGTLTKQTRWPDPKLVAQARQELAELNVSISELRAVVAYLNDFEAEEPLT
ncbi:hypothetical protein M2J84_07750 [Comamonas aquatica]|uniref:hypothetical protein n=1 Tax=Comamonas aquatica TaxID=225991 RepID=UPI0022DD2B8F|nr:hypothetical protein [Comamonas aquatica]WBM43482.1 hypothetical protein M2J84_07750 [Comamonas aquatica]